MVFAMRGLLAIATIWLIAIPAHAAALAVVFAVDVSNSVSAGSYILQRDGIARAFANSQLERAITNTPGGIEALVLEWSDPDRIAVTAAWTHIVDGKSATAFSAAVHATARTSSGLTAIGSALVAAAAEFERLPQPAARRLIDISGDGMANLGPAPAPVRDRIVRAGITINGLAILTEEPWLAGYYRDNVIGGPGAFVLTADNFQSFSEAMLRKLTTEVAGAEAPAVAQMQ
jgi:hypothetical protein